MLPINEHNTFNSILVNKLPSGSMHTAISNIQILQFGGPYF